MKNTKVIAAFPACGKTFYFNNIEGNTIVLDSDSSKFSWVEIDDGNNGWRRERNPDFPKNYIDHIKENIGEADYIFVSTHEVVRKALTEAEIDFSIVFPKQSLKEEWIGRCFLRGSNEEFCQMIADQWDYWILQMEEEVVINNRNHYRLAHGEHLSDAIVYFERQRNGQD